MPVAAAPPPELNNAGNPNNPNAANAAAAAAAAVRGPSSILSAKRLFIYGALTIGSTVAVTLNAFRQRSNYYAAAVWLGRSNGCMLILLNFGIFSALMHALAVQWVFFGQLRPIEVEHLHERAWYALTESLLAMTIFRDEFDVKFVIMFGTLLFLKVFHWLSEDRVDYMEQTPSVSRLFHVRMVSMLGTMAVVDLALVAWSLEAIYLDSKQLGLTIMFSTEFMVLLASNFSIGAKYLINCIDAFSEDVWEKKSMYVFYVDLLTDFIKLVVYTFFFSFILATYGFPFNLVRDVVFTARSFFTRVRDLIRYREATRNMNERYPDATVADMEALSDGTCIICRDDMLVAGAEGTPPGQPSAQETPKKLPCGHIFHFHCLRSWLERQQSCPTCRRTVLQAGETPAAGAGAAAGQQRAGAGAAPPAPAPGARPVPPGANAAAAAATAGTGQGTAAAGPTAPTPTRAPGTSSSNDATRSGPTPTTAAGSGPTRTTAAASSSAQRRRDRERGRDGGAGGDGWNVQMGLDRVRRGLEQMRAEAEQRRSDYALATGGGGGGAGLHSNEGEGSQQQRERRGAATFASSAGTARTADLDRIPMTLLEMMFETTFAKEREVHDLGRAGGGAVGGGPGSAVVLPLSHATGEMSRSVWVPPRPEELPVLKSTVGLGAPSPSKAESSTAKGTEFVRSGAPSPPLPAAGGDVAAKGDGDGEGGERERERVGGEDPDDPRRAVREAALRRFGSVNPAPVPAPAPASDSSAAETVTTTAAAAGPVPTPTSTEVPTPALQDKGKGKDVVRGDDDVDVSPPSLKGTRTLPGNPRLTPLSTGLLTSSTSKDKPTTSLPFPLNNEDGSRRSLVPPPTLDDQAVQERLETLERLQGVIGDAVGELQRMLRSDGGAAAAAPAVEVGREREESSDEEY
ncbi:unnamed protein product [Tilletia controversa]|nr:unnamed protein product [Tilletia controversa]